MENMDELRKGKTSQVQDYIDYVEREIGEIGSQESGFRRRLALPEEVKANLRLVAQEASRAASQAEIKKANEAATREVQAQKVAEADATQRAVKEAVEELLEQLH